jgi:actin
MEASLIVDIGSSSTKIGYTGDDIPSWVIPTSVERPKAGGKDAEAVENVAFNPDKDREREDTTIPSGVLMHRGIVHDWDEMEKFWHTITDEVGMNTVNIEKTPVLLIDSPLSTIADRVKWAEILFEGYHVPSICIGNSASLSVFAAGRATGVVVDVGGGLMTAVPVFEGLALMHACVEMEYAGMDVTGRLKKTLLDQSGVNLNFADTKVLKERFAYVNKTAPTPLPISKRRSKKEAAPPSEEAMEIYLPDGSSCSVDQKIFGDCTEGLFSNKESTFGGLSKSVYESLLLCDDSIMGELKSNVIISGGTSMTNGLGDRLQNDLQAMFDQNSKAQSSMGETVSSLRVMPSSYHRESGYTNQRKHAAWQGGSIFASFESFKNLRVTRQEFEEGVEASLLAKCF